MIVETSNPSLTEKAVAAMRAAVARVVEDHRRRGKPLAVWRDGRVVQESSVIADEVREAVGYYQTDQPAGDLNDKNTKEEEPG
jgi:hypothetical protein